MKVLDIKEITSTLTSQDPAGNEIPLLLGAFVDFADIETENIDAVEVRQNTAIKALKDLGLTDKPMMAFDIAPLPALELSHKGERMEFPEDQASSKNYAKVIVPCSQIVDIKNLKPVAGESAVRCNPAFPTYRWFQAINAILSYENKTQGRVVPFPLQVDDGENGTPELIYHAMRVNKQEYEAYQKLLMEACRADGVEMGFYHAAKFAYEIIHKRGHKHVTQKEIGEAVTKITMMGRPQIKAVIVANATHDDFQGKIRTGHYVFST